MVGSDCIDLLDHVTEGHGLVREQLKELMWSTLPSQQFELLVYRSCPCNNDARRNLDGGVMGKMKDTLIWGENSRLKHQWGPTLYNRRSASFSYPSKSRFAHIVRIIIGSR